MLAWLKSDGNLKIPTDFTCNPALADKIPRFIPSPTNIILEYGGAWYIWRGAAPDP